MADRYRLEISSRDQTFSFALEKEVGLGRQLTPSEPIGKLHAHPGSGEDRIAVAPFSEVRVSRRQLVLRPAAGGVLVVNPSTNAVFIDGISELAASEQHLCTRESQVLFGPNRAYKAHVWLEQDESFDLHTLPHEPPLPGSGRVDRPSDVLESLELAGDSAAVRVKLASLIEVLQKATGSGDYLSRAARSVVELTGLDSAQVLFLEDGQWRPGAEHHCEESTAQMGYAASRRMLARMLADRRTVWSDGLGVLAGDFSQKGVMAVVCAPICSKSGDVIGALYGDRQSSLSAKETIGPSEAIFVEALAYVISVGLERQNQENEALEQRFRFEQFFGRELADQLAANPEMLTGKEALVTILIADIRSFSAASERLGASLTLQWIQDTLDELTKIVMHYGGVVDYVGDAVIAMWGAPVEQPDQAKRACQAALEMQVAEGPLNARWMSRIDMETQLAIGIHTGMAQVGNIGSRRKFKYGALGHTVNLASRVQGSTKHLRTSLLITKATYDALGSGFLTRRIGSVQVINIEEPVDVYEVRLIDDERGRVLCQLYEKALGEFEAKQFRRAARTLGDYIPNYEDDGPSHILLWRAVNGLVQPAEVFEPAWKLPGK